MNLHNAYKTSLQAKSDYREVVQLLVETEKHVRNLFVLSVCYLAVTWNWYCVAMVFFLGALYFYISRHHLLTDYYLRKKIDAHRERYFALKNAKA